ncbi:hypothetical protein ILUMI_12446 [Ignelater luminosus]|uniref:Uncharacterized protein n=1 Tax=Ignelater luminosus TaxID=2038154 RepID=A0A8K0GCY1_IGNLU|nr:hypothetical protein ILUMI_12446 [Ignelater luminosus]
MLKLLSLYVILISLYLFSPEQKPRKPFSFQFQQSDYKCKPERVEVVSFNRSYMEYLKIKTFKFNRTCTAFNFSLKYIIDIENHLDVSALKLLLFVFSILQKNGRPNFKFQQNDYQCKPERGDIVSYNKTLLEYLKLRTFKYNRTCTAFNFSVNYKIDFGRKMEVSSQISIKWHNLNFLISCYRFQLTVCEVFALNLIGMRSSNRCGNFTGCPLLKERHYHLCNFVPDLSKLPPFIPNGRYMFELQGVYLSEDIWLARVYGEVYRP